MIGAQTTPRLPATFAAHVDVPSMGEVIDVARWYRDFSLVRAEDGLGACNVTAEANAAQVADASDRASDGQWLSGCDFGRPRTFELSTLNLSGMEPSVLAEAQLEQAYFVQTGSRGLDFPAYEVALGEVDDDPDAVQPDNVGQRFVIARSHSFDADGVARVELSDGALDTLAAALGEQHGVLQVGPLEGEAPSLTSTPEGLLRRPTGDAGLTLVVALHVPVSALLDTTAEASFRTIDDGSNGDVDAAAED